MHPGEVHAEHAHGADCIEEDLECAEEGFAEDAVEEDDFEGGGEVGVEAVDAEGFVVGKVVRLLSVLILDSLFLPCSTMGQHTLKEAL